MYVRKTCDLRSLFLLHIYYSGFWKSSQAFWSVSNYHPIDKQASPKARPISYLRTAKELLQRKLSYITANVTIPSSERTVSRLKKVSCFLHFSCFLKKHTVANKHFNKTTSCSESPTSNWNATKPRTRDNRARAFNSPERDTQS